MTVRVCAALALICVLLSAAAILIGRQLAPPTPSIIAQNPCALPCFFGVTPGQTSREQAVRALASYQAIQVGGQLAAFQLADQEGRASVVSVNFDSGAQVASVRIVAVDLLADVGTLSDLLLAGQAPHRVFRTCDGVLPVRLLMTFGDADQLVVELFPQGDTLAPETPITLFDLSTAASRSLFDARSSFGCSVETGWLGFAPLWTYERARSG